MSNPESDKPVLLFGKLDGCPVQAPIKAREQDAGFDVYANSGASLMSGERQKIMCRVHVKVPEGHCALVLPRSGLAAEHGVTVLNAPGLIDPNYLGEIGIVLINHGFDEYHIRPGDRIAQLLIVKLADVGSVAMTIDEFWKHTVNSGSDRGTAGFGRSGR